VYLPKGTAWVDFWTGNTFNGGKAVIAAAPISRIPLFVKAGSVIPFGPGEQYTGEVKADTLELRVYPGADGRFNIYEDDGQTYNYKHGEYSVIPIRWNDKTKTLTIDKRQGSFKGMLQKRVFRVAAVGKTKGLGFETIQSKAIVYRGNACTIKI